MYRPWRSWTMDIYDDMENAFTIGSKKTEMPGEQDARDGTKLYVYSH